MNWRWPIDQTGWLWSRTSPVRPSNTDFRALKGRDGTILDSDANDKDGLLRREGSSWGPQSLKATGPRMQKCLPIRKAGVKAQGLSAAGWWWLSGMAMLQHPSHNTGILWRWAQQWDVVSNRHTDTHTQDENLKELQSSLTRETETLTQTRHQDQSVSAGNQDYVWPQTLGKEKIQKLEGSISTKPSVAGKIWNQSSKKHRGQCQGVKKEARGMCQGARWTRARLIAQTPHASLGFQFKSLSALWICISV